MAAAKKRWSARVARSSDALTLEQGIFTSRSPKRIAQSPKDSAEHSRRRKAGPFQSAMSMLNFFINRMGRQLSATRRQTLDKAKDELRALYGRRPSTAKKAPASKASASRASKSAARPKARTKPTVRRATTRAAHA